MKAILTAVALSLAVTPAMSIGIDASSLTPVLTYPDPAPTPVTKDQTGIDK